MSPTEAIKVLEQYSSYGARHESDEIYKKFKAAISTVSDAVGCDSDWLEEGCPISDFTIESLKAEWKEYQKS